MISPDSFPILETSRLILRELVVQDAPSLFAIYADIEHMRWYGIDQNARQTPSFRAGKDSGDAEGVLQCGVLCCSIYWRMRAMGAPPQLPAK